MSPDFMTVIRLLVGIYLLYIDYSVFDYMLERTGGEKIAIIAIMILFLFSGVILIFTSAKSLYESKYKKKDDTEETEAESEQEETVSDKKSEE